MILSHFGLLGTNSNWPPERAGTQPAWKVVLRATEQFWAAFQFAAPQLLDDEDLPCTFPSLPCSLQGRTGRFGNTLMLADSSLQFAPNMLGRAPQAAVPRDKLPAYSDHVR